jgi:muconolactone delta-isomerase
MELRNRRSKTARRPRPRRRLEEGHLVRLWKEAAVPGETKILGLYRADSDAQLESLLGALPLYQWMDVTVTPLQPHSNDPMTAPAAT